MPFEVRRSVSIAIFAAFVGVNGGCGDGRPDRVPVSGTVLIDGQPLKHGYVRFVPTGARASGGEVDGSGRFSLTCFEPGDGAVLGTHRVEVMTRERLTETKSLWHAPKKYADFKSSGLTQEIDGPSDSVEIHLSWEGGKPFVEIDETEAGARAPRKGTETAQ